MNQTLDDVVEDLEFLDDDLERYRYVIDLGDKLPALPPEAQTPDRLVAGCTSKVWMDAQWQGSPPRLALRAEADAQIVRGLVALLVLAFAGRTPEEVLEVDVEALLDRLRFTEQLTPGRQNGLHAMVQRIRSLAEQARYGAPPA